MLTIGKYAPDAGVLSLSEARAKRARLDLLPGTVRDNLSLAAPRAADEEMWAALRLAHIADALARAFVSQRPILLLDELSEGLDAIAEAAVASAIAVYVGAVPGRLALFVSHRDGLKPVAQKLVDLDLALAP